MRLYRTGETHQNGWDVFRKVNDKPRSNSKGLSGTYYLWDGERMYSVGSPYKDCRGWNDGEPFAPIRE